MMSFVECVESYNKMCNSYLVCSKCPLKEKAKDYTLCSTYAFKHPDDFANIVEKWKKTPIAEELKNLRYKERE